MLNLSMASSTGTLFHVIKGTYLILEKIDLVSFEKTTNFFDREEPEREHEKTVFVGS